MSLWTDDKPDIVSNLTSLLSSDSIVTNTFRELDYFQVQLPKIVAQVNSLSAEIALLLRVLNVARSL